MNNSSTIPDTALDDFRYIGSDSIADKNFTKEMLKHYSPEMLREIALSLYQVGHFLFGSPLRWDDLKMERRPASPGSPLQYVLILKEPITELPDTDKEYSPIVFSYSPTVNPLCYKYETPYGSDVYDLSRISPFIPAHLFHLYAVSTQERTERDFYQRVTPTIS